MPRSEGRNNENLVNYRRVDLLNMFSCQIKKIRIEYFDLPYKLTQVSLKSATWEPFSASLKFQRRGPNLTSWNIPRSPSISE